MKKKVMNIEEFDDDAGPVKATSWASGQDEKIEKDFGNLIVWRAHKKIDDDSKENEKP